MIRISPVATSDRWTRPSSAPLHQAKAAHGSHSSSFSAALNNADARTLSSQHENAHWSSAIPSGRQEPHLASGHPLQPVKGRSRKLKFIESARLQIALANRPSPSSFSSPSRSADISSAADNTYRSTITVDASTPAPVAKTSHTSSASLEAQLVSDLARVAPTDDYRRLNAHRLAFASYIATQDPATQRFLNRVLYAYESVEVHKFQKSFDEVTERLQAAELVARQAINERNVLQKRCESLHLSILNLEKQLNARNEMISHISHQFRINTSALNWMTGETTGNPTLSSAEAAALAPKSRTMAEIRAMQTRVTLTHNEAMKQSAKESRAEAGNTEHEVDAADAQACEELDRRIANDGVNAFHGVPQVKKASQPVVDQQAPPTVSELYVMSGHDDYVGVELSEKDAPT
jgi:hypothetical protein